MSLKRKHSWAKLSRLKLPSTEYFNPHGFSRSCSSVAYEPQQDADADADAGAGADDQESVTENLTGGANRPSKWSKETTELFFRPRTKVSNAIRDQRDWVWACDLMFVERSDRAADRPIPIFCAIEITSRLGFACILKNGRGTMDKSAAAVIQCLNKLLAFAGPARLKHMVFDLGPEFDNKQVKAWTQKHCGEAPYYFDSHSKNQKGMIERFNRTVRAHLMMWAKSKDPLWSDEALAQFVKSYNNERHSGMRGATPNDAAGSSKDSATLRSLIRLAASVRSKPYEATLKTFKPGDRVRVWVGADPAKTPAQLTSEATMGRKLGQRWTDEVYTVESVGNADRGSSKSEGGPGTTKNPGWYITLEGVGSHTAATARRFSPNDLFKVESKEGTAHAQGAPAASADEVKKLKAKMAREAKKAAKQARFLGMEGLDEAAAAQRKVHEDATDAQTRALEMAMARQLASQKQKKSPPTLDTRTAFEREADAIVADKYKKVPQRKSARKKT